MRFPSRKKCFAKALLMGAIVLTLAGCASPAKNSPTGGLELTMYVHDGTGAETYYHVQRDGSLGFGGGLKARFFQTTWADQMSSDEINQLRGLLAAQNWFRPPPESTNRPPEHVYRVVINAPENHKQFRVKGESEALRPIHNWLDAIARRRLEPELRSLPAPSRVQQTQPSSTQPAVP